MTSYNFTISYHHFAKKPAKVSAQMLLTLRALVFYTPTPTPLFLV